MVHSADWTWLCVGVHGQLNFPASVRKFVLSSLKYFCSSIEYPFVIYQFSSVQSVSHVWLFETLWISACKASLSITTPGVHWDSCPSSQWCHPAISSSGVPFSSCPQSLPASESFPISHLFAWGGQSAGVSALASFLPKKSQGWSPSEWTGWISLQSKGLSRVWKSSHLYKHQFAVLFLFTHVITISDDLHLFLSTNPSSFTPLCLNSIIYLFFSSAAILVIHSSTFVYLRTFFRHLWWRILGL